MSRLAMDVVASQTDYSKDPKFTEAVANKVYYGPVYFRRESEPYMTLSLAGTRRDAGVSVAEVNLKLIWEVVSQIKVGERGQAYVVDAQGRLIAHPDISLVLAQHRHDVARAGAGRARGRHRLAAGAGAGGQDIRGRQVLTAYAPVASPGWIVFVELPSDEAYAPLVRIDPAFGLAAAPGPVARDVSGVFLARRMVVPIQALRAGAARIGGGDLAQRISIKTGDELEGACRPVQRHGGQAAGVVRRPREKGRGPHPRTDRVAGAADGDIGGAARHQQLARRTAAGVRGHAGECDADLRGEVRICSCG